MARIFIEGHHFSPARLSASGYAEFHPATTNTTTEGRAQNRRVDIIVIPRVTAPRAPALDVPSTRPESITAAIPGAATAQAAVTPPSISR
jgi:chemotaxis protein MotB